MRDDHIIRSFNFEVKLQNDKHFLKVLQAKSLPHAWTLLDAELTGKYVVSKTYLGDSK